MENGTKYTQTTYWTREKKTIFKNCQYINWFYDTNISKVSRYSAQTNFSTLKIIIPIEIKISSKFSNYDELFFFIQNSNLKMNEKTSTWVKKNPTNNNMTGFKWINVKRKIKKKNLRELTHLWTSKQGLQSVGYVSCVSLSIKWPLWIV